MSCALRFVLSYAGSVLAWFAHYAVEVNEPAFPYFPNF